MKTLYLIGIAINNYPNPEHCLKGCVGDRDSLLSYIKKRYASDFDRIDPLILTNKEAIRKRVIASFEHFNQSQTGDTCLFYFAGHGSRITTPAVFSHLEETKLQTIVCYDSRKEGGKDLLDKELSYLIWSVTEKRGQKPHFLAIMDCCYSSTNTRKKVTDVTKYRSINETEPGTNDANYLGVLEYKRDAEQQYTPPKANHLLLAAALPHQKAKEVRTKDGEIRGAFTYCILEFLKNTVTPPSYQKLIDYVSLRIKTVVREQNPVLETYRSVDKELSFLTGELIEREHKFLLSHNSIDKWFVNVGLLHGIAISSSEEPIIFIANDGSEATVTKVLEDKCLVNGLNDKLFNKFKVYEVALKLQPYRKYEIMMNSTIKEEVSAKLIQADTELNHPLFRITKKKSGIFALHQDAKFLWLSTNENDTPLFEPLPLAGYSSFERFLLNIGKVINWFHVKDIENLTTVKLPATNFNTEVWYKQNTSASASHHAIDAEKIDLIYHGNQLPSFSVKINNTSTNSFWCCAFYLGHDFSITDELLPSKKINPKEFAWLQHHHDTYSTRNIQVAVNKTSLNKGINHINEYLKIIISTKAITSQNFNQKKISNDLPTRSYNLRRRSPKGMLWATKTISLKIKKIDT